MELIDDYITTRYNSFLAMLKKTSTAVIGGTEYDEEALGTMTPAEIAALTVDQAAAGGPWANWTIVDNDRALSPYGTLAVAGKTEDNIHFSGPPFTKSFFKNAAYVGYTAVHDVAFMLKAQAAKVKFAKKYGGPIKLPINVADLPKGIYFTGHAHKWQVDANGNGSTSWVSSPTLPNVFHAHKITSWQLHSAPSYYGGSPAAGVGSGKNSSEPEAILAGKPSLFGLGWYDNPDPIDAIGRPYLKLGNDTSYIFDHWHDLGPWKELDKYGNPLKKHFKWDWGNVNIFQRKVPGAHWDTALPSNWYTIECPEGDPCIGIGTIYKTLGDLPPWTGP